MKDESYTWTQEFTEVEMVFPIEDKADKSAVRLLAMRNSIKVMYRDVVLTEGELFQPIKAEEAYWYISENKLVVVLSKTKGSWWECVIKGHSKVDTEKIAETKTVSDLSTLDPEERKIVQEMMYNQKSKASNHSESEEVIKRLSRKGDGFFDQKDIAR